MKRIITLIAACIMIVFSTIYSFPVSSADELHDMIIPVVSDIAGIMHLQGKSNSSLLKNGTFMVPIKDACKIADASIMIDDGECIIITRNTVSWGCEYVDAENQYLIVDMHTGEGDYYQSINQQLKDKPWLWIISKDINREFEFNQYDKIYYNRAVNWNVKTNIAFQMIDNELYVSLCPFLETMGVKIQIMNNELMQQKLELLNYIAEISNSNKRFTLADLKEMYNINIGCETYLSCELGQPIDELYQEYYNENYKFKLSDYYSDSEIFACNIANSTANFDGFFKTIGSAEDLDAKYEEALINILTQYGTNDKHDLTDEIQKNANYYSLFSSGLDFFIDQNEDLLKIKQIITLPSKKKLIDTITKAHMVNNFNDYVKITDLFGFFVSGYIGYHKACSNINQLETLFEDEKIILKESILSSEDMQDRAKADKRNKLFSKTLANMFGITGNLSYTLYNTSKINNSDFNLYQSTRQVQLYIEDPERAKANAALYEVFCSLGDTITLNLFDKAVCKGIPISQIACSLMQTGATLFQNTDYFKISHKVSNIDDYVFIQNIAKDCFNNHYLQDEGEYYSFLLSVKATLMAYVDNETDINKQRKLESILSNAVAANKDYFIIDPDFVPDLSVFDDITVNPTSEPSTTSPLTTFDISTVTTVQEVSNDVYYQYIESELIPEYGLADLSVPETDFNNEPNYSGINGIISAYIKEFDNEKYLITVRFSDSSDIRHLVLDMYNYQNGSVNKVDTYDAEISDYMMGFNVGCIDNYIFMNYYNHFNYVSSRYDNNWFVLEINSTGFNKSFSLNYSHGANGYTWIRNSFSEDKTYFLTENGDGNGLDKAIEEIKADLNAIGLNSYNISADLDPESFIFEIINTDNISEYSLYDQKAIDYTDLRSHLSSSSSSNSTTETTSNIEPETKSSIYAEPQIEVFTAAPWANGLTFVLHMSGVYDYYTYEAYENSMGNVNLCSSDSTNKQTIILTSGSTIASVKVSVTPYSQNGEAGETVEVEANDNNLSYLSPIEFIDKKGTINAQNGVVSGYDETYVIYHGKPNEKIRESLDDGWHITAVAKYESDGITWYKLYDTDDNDYYGWVDSSYINFY